jgi:hypothetical protein
LSLGVLPPIQTFSLAATLFKTIPMDKGVKKEEPAATGHPAYANLDVQNVSDPVWFLRLPDFLFSELRGKTSRVQIGKIRIDSTEDPANPKITIIFNQNAVSRLPFEGLPETFDVRAESEIHEHQYLFSHRRDCGYVRIIGHVIGEAHLSGPDTQKLAQCRRLYEELGKPKKTMKVQTMLDSLPRLPDPQAALGWRAQRKKPVKDKRLKMSAKEVKMELLIAFRQKPEWAIRDLSERMNQATDTISKVIGDVADYDQRARVYRVKPATQLYDDDDD